MRDEGGNTQAQGMQKQVKIELRTQTLRPERPPHSIYGQ
jgi:hypothetical protein